MMRLIIVFISMVCLLNACKVNNSSSQRSRNETDSAYVLVQETDTSDIYQLIYQQKKKTKKIFEVQTSDESSLSFLYCFQNDIIDYECFSFNNNGADCNRFIFFDRKSKLFYITNVCFSGFYPRKSSLDFVKQTLILENNYSDGFKDIELNDSILYVSYNDSIKSIKSNLVHLLKKTK